MGLQNFLDRFKLEYERNRVSQKPQRTAEEYNNILKTHRDYIILVYTKENYPSEFDIWKWNDMIDRVCCLQDIRKIRELLNLRHSYYITFTTNKNYTREENEAAKAAFLARRQEIIDSGVDARYVPNIEDNHLPRDRKVQEERGGPRRAAYTAPRRPFSTPYSTPSPGQTHSESYRPSGYSNPQPPPRAPDTSPPVDNSEKGKLLAELRRLNPPVTTKKESKAWRLKYHPDTFRPQNNSLDARGAEDNAKAKRAAEEMFQLYNPKIQKALDNGWIE